MNRHVVTLALLALAAGSAFANGRPIIVTAEVPKDAAAPALTGHDVIARVDKQVANVTQWHALRDDPAGLELWILIDDGTDSQIGIQFNDLRDFIRQQAPKPRWHSAT